MDLCFLEDCAGKIKNDIKYSNDNNHYIFFIIANK